MTLTITRADFADPRLARFLQEHLDDMAPTAPAESRHALDLSALRQSGVRLWAVMEQTGMEQSGTAGGAAELVATGALAALAPGHEELKSMRTDPARRGRGLARLLLAHLLEDAASRGVGRISLETGSMEFFAPARSLYAAAGFSVCPPFGSYREDPNSVFMTLELPVRSESAAR